MTLDINISHFKLKYIVGRGGFGEVWKVQRKGTDKFYAMKEMHKGKIVLKKSSDSILHERELLSYLKHPFIINMHFAF